MSIQFQRIDDDRPVGKLTRVPDFLPAPEVLLPPENVTKITIAVDVDTIEFFKKVAKKNGTKYQRMMREVLNCMKLVCISDTHCQLEKVDIPSGDILFHAGDLTYSGSYKETKQEIEKLGKYRDKFDSIVLINGNHDWLSFREPELMSELCRDLGITLLGHESIEVNGLKIFGSHWQPEFMNWCWGLVRGEALKEKWAEIPDDTEILITHSPAYGILDLVERYEMHTGDFSTEHVGCEELAKRIRKLKKLKVHISGHLHLNGGLSEIVDGVTHVNASCCDEQYRISNKAVVVDL